MPRFRLTPATAGVLTLLAIVVWLVGAPIAGLLVGSITDTPPGVAVVGAPGYAEAGGLVAPCGNINAGGCC